MFIELTDHLRCTAAHAESYLVLLPGEMKGRNVVTGDLGCPLCGRVVRIEDGVADFGGGTPATAETALSAEAVATFLGLGGPGGFVALLGGPATLAPDLAQLMPDIGLVLVNPPEGTRDTAAGILRAGRLPLKSHSMRGIVLGTDVSGAPEWVEAAARSVLSGLRVIGEGGKPPERDVTLLGSSLQAWVVSVASPLPPLRPAARPRP